MNASIEVRSDPATQGPAKRRVLVIAHDPSGGAGMIGQRLVERGFDIVEHVVCDHPDFPESFRPIPINTEDFDLVLIMGAVWSVYDRAAIGEWIDDELEMVRRRVEIDRPTLGICFGGQAITAALGGTVEPAPQTEIGWYDIERVRADDSQPVRGPWFEWHHDQFHVPDGVEVLATNSAGEQLFRVGRTVGTQFHPEVDPEHLDGFLEFASDEYLGQYGVQRGELRASVVAHREDARRNCFEFVDWYLDLADLGS